MGWVRIKQSFRLERIAKWLTPTVLVGLRSLLRPSSAKIGNLCDTRFRVSLLSVAAFAQSYCDLTSLGGGSGLGVRTRMLDGPEGGNCCGFGAGLGLVGVAMSDPPCLERLLHQYWQ